MFEAGFSGDGGPAIFALLDSPTGVGVDVAGNLYIVDAGNQRIRKVNRDGIITTIAGNGRRGLSGDGGPAIDASLNLAPSWRPTTPSGNVAVDAAGTLYIADTGNGRIRKVTPDGIITSVAFVADPWSVAVDLAGNLYIAENTPHLGGAVHKLTPGGTMTRIAGSGDEPVSGPLGPFGDSGLAVNAWLLFSTGVAVDAAGNVYIADSGAQRIRKVDREGKITTVAGSGNLVIVPPDPILGEGGGYYVTGGFSGDGGLSTNAQLSAPWGVAVDAFGRVYIADSENNRIRKISAAATVSAASFSAAAIASKAIVAVFDVDLATASLAAVATPLPTSLAGTQVLIKDSAGNELLSPLFYVSPSQVNCQIPIGTSTGAATISVTNSNGRVSTGIMNIRATAPSLFTINQQGSGVAAAHDALTYSGPPFLATQTNGEPNIITFYGTGLGADATDLDTSVNLSESVEVRIDEQPVTVLYAGSASGFVGLNQFNVVLPTGISPGTHTLVVSRDGIQSNAVEIPIQAPVKPRISGAQAEPNKNGPVCNVLFFCENIVSVSGENFSAAATIEIRTGTGGILVAEYQSLKIARADAIEFILDERFTPNVIYLSGGLLVTVVNPGKTGRTRSRSCGGQGITPIHSTD